MTKRSALFIAVLATVGLVSMPQRGSGIEAPSVGQADSPNNDSGRAGPEDVRSQKEAAHDADVPAAPVNPTDAPLPPRPSADEIFPFDQGFQLWTEAPKPAAKRAPLLYIAPLAADTDRQTTMAKTVGDLVRWHIRAAPKNQLLINIIPYAHIEAGFEDSDSDNNELGHPESRYLKEASALGADIFLYGKVGGTDAQPAASIRCIDLNTSKSDTFVVGPAKPSVVIGEITQRCARTCGLTDAQTQAAGMLTGLPSDATWKHIVTKEGDVRAVAATDRECRYVHTQEKDGLWHSGSLLDQAVRKWPDDPRLIRDKYQSLRAQNKHYAALILLMGQLSRTPDELLSLSALGNVLSDVYASKADPRTAPPAFQAGIAAMESFLERYPHYWPCWRNLAQAESYLGWHIRGTRTINFIADSALRNFATHAKRAAERIDRALELKTDSIPLIVSAIALHHKAGEKNTQWQIAMIDRVRNLDPDNFQAELQVAACYSVGWGDPKIFWLIALKAADNHKDNAWAMAQIADSMAAELRRLVSWKALTEDAAFKEKNEMNQAILKCSEFAIDRKIQLGREHFITLHRIYKLQHGEELAQKFLDESGQWYGYHTLGMQHMRSSEWEAALKYAKLATPLTPSTETHYWQGNQYLLGYSLWKLKRYDEALMEARKGIALFPESPLFHALFASVANEHGQPLEEGYREAYIAVDLGLEAKNVVDVFESLRQKLGKPEHPRLRK